MKTSIQAVFLLRPGERRGLIISVLLLVSSVIIRLSTGSTSTPVMWRMSDSTAAEVMDMIAQVRAEEIQQQAGNQVIEKSEFELKPYPFDPNTVTESELIRMGVPARIASNLCSYREAGGSFKTVKSLRKIYGMNDHLW